MLEHRHNPSQTRRSKRGGYSKLAPMPASKGNKGIPWYTQTAAAPAKIGIFIVTTAECGPAAQADG